MPIELEALLNQLDEEWTSRGGCKLEALVKRVPPDCMKMAIELCVADFEWRMRKFSQSEQLSPAHELSTMKPYRVFLEKWWDSTECQKTLVQSEWLARSVWGDKPRIDSFLTAQDHNVCSGDELIESLNLSTQIEVRVQIQDQEPLTWIAPAEFGIGRQKLGEVPPPYLDQTSNRLIAWRLEVLQVSREQLSVRRVRLTELQIENVSSNRAIRINNFLLQPLQACYVQLPLVLNIADTTITIRSLSV